MNRAGKSSVERVVYALRNAALSAEPGKYLGSEEELCKRYAVSTPTLRQAGRQLEHEEVLKIKRGVRGGYFAHRPSIDTITRVAATYLRGNVNSIDEVVVLLDALMPLIIRLAMRSDRRDALKEFAKPCPKLPPWKVFFDNESRFSTTLRDLSENAPLQLILSIFYQINLTVALAEIKSDDAMLLAVQQSRIDLARSILARDEDASIRFARQHRELIYGGVRRQLAALKGTGKSRRGKREVTRVRAGGPP